LKISHKWEYGLELALLPGRMLATGLLLTHTKTGPV
jgi:hypothetical protein